MKCKFDHHSQCCNSGSSQYKCGCKQPCDSIAHMTNADRIRAMTDEELCEFLSQYKFCDICEEGCENCSYNGDCERRLADWLKQPAEGDA